MLKSELKITYDVRTSHRYKNLTCIDTPIGALKEQHHGHRNFFTKEAQDFD